MNTSTLTNEELDTSLISFLNSSVLASIPYHLALFQTLYDHGFRIREIENCHEWLPQPNGTVICKTLKGSSDRIIPEVEFHPRMIDSFTSGTNFVWTTSYSTIERFFDNNNGVLKYLVNDSPITTHIFRHNRIKQLIDGGKTIEEVKTIMGLNSTSVTEGYRDSIIKKVTV